MEYKDYYHLIGVNPDATADDIEKAYRTLARKYHPDINPNDAETLQRFQEITEAHTVLLEASKRAKYDQLQTAWQAHQGSPAMFDWTPWLTTQEVSFTAEQAEYSLFFKAIFGTETISSPEPVIIKEPTATPEPPQKNKKYEYVQPFEITIDESFKGASKVLKIGDQSLMVKIPRGAKNGTRIRVVGKQIALPTADGSMGPAGDLFLEIKFAPHAIFEAVGDDLQAELPLNLYTAILGGEATVPNLSKGVIKLKIPAETQPGRLFRLKGLGLPQLQNPDERGDLLVKVTVTLPQNLTPEEIALFEELADLRGL
jgi:curved DNA-binding protein